VGLHHLSGIDALLEDARRRITRLTPAEAYGAWQEGALLVDTRSSDQLEDGAIPGAVRHALSVVLWRLDELPRETRVILICRHGESSSIAAAQLVQMGFREAADVIGGAEAWRAAGLPVVVAGGGDEIV
jgi:rhodanese-related sulfurtransferase